jgi:hypothetical protein
MYISLTTNERGEALELNINGVELPITLVLDALLSYNADILPPDLAHELELYLEAISDNAISEEDTDGEE